MKNFRFALAGIALAVAVPAAHATTTFSFICATNNSGVCATQVAPQFEVTVSDGGAGQVDFLFSNLGPLTMTAANIYWQGTTLDYPTAVINNTAGITFNTGGAPANPPGANAFVTDFRIRAANPAPQNGLNAGESLLVSVDLNSGTYASYLLGLNGGSNSLAMHAINFGQFSETLVLGPPTSVIPVPAALPLMLSGLVGFGLLARRRRNIA